jgi:DNA-directed RNA polymerase specialized sigma24 family protein
MSVLDACILCGKPSVVLALFRPHAHARAWLRAMAYSLCRKCMRRPDRMQRVEIHAARANDPQRN